MSTLFDAFISYGRADSKAFATKLQSKLADQGFKVWFDFNDIPLAVDFQNQIDDGIEKADHFLFVISPHAVNSPYCRKEIELALHYNKRIIPLLHVMQISQETWQQRNPDGTPEEWQNYQEKGLDQSYQNMLPIIRKLNWIYFQDDQNNFDQSLQDLVGLLRSHADYVTQHTQLLVSALEWNRHEKQISYLLTDNERHQAKTWLKRRFKNEQPPCAPTDLHGEFITESIKNANNLMTQVFLSYAREDMTTMEKIRNSLRREGITVWTDNTDIQTGETFEKAIRQGIEQADNIVYLLSPEATASIYCQKELEIALSLNKRIIPILVRDTNLDLVCSKLRELQYIDLTDNIKDDDYRLDESQLLKTLRQDEAYCNEHKILLTKALKWKQQQNNPSLLLREFNLQSAESWLKIAQKRKQYSPVSLQEEFITASSQQPPLESIDLFISYSRSDSDFVRKLNDAFQMQGKTTWFDQESLASESEIEQETKQGIKISDNFLFILSPKSNSSPECLEAIKYAASLNKRFVVVLHREINTTEFPPQLDSAQWIDFTQNQGDFNAIFNQVVRALDTDRDYVHSHSKWLRRSLEWEQKNRSTDLLLRGNEFLVAQDWLLEAQAQKKSPMLTQLQEQYIQASHIAIQARIAKEKRQVLILRSLLGLVSAAFIISVGAGIFAFNQYQEAQRSRIRAEKKQLVALTMASEALLLSEQEFQALIEALKAGATLQSTTWSESTPDITTNVLSVLQRAIYWTKERNQLQGHEGALWRVVFSPDGDIIATASQDKTVKLWTAEGEELKTLEGHQANVYGVNFSPDSQTLVTASEDETVKVWTASGELQQTLIGHQAAVRDVHFSPDGQSMISAGDDQTIKIWSADGQLRQTITGHQGPINQIAISPNRELFATASNDQTVKIWTMAGQLYQTLEDHTDNVSAVSFSPDGQTLATASYDQTVKLWNLDGTLLKTLTGHTDKLLAVSFSPDGQTLASGGYDLQIKLWNLNGQVLDTLTGSTNLITSLSFSPDRQTLASANFDHSVKLWQAAGGGLQTLSGHDNWIFGLAYSPDGEHLATASRDRTVKLWTSTGKLITTLSHQEPVWSVSFSPDGQHMVTASNDNTATLWDREGNTLKTFIGHQKGVLAATFSPDGQTIATASDDHTVKLWTVDGNLIETLTDHGERVGKVRFSPDGQAIATASDDQTVKLWNRQGQVLTTLTGHQASVVDVHFSPDGQTIATASDDHTAKLWDREGNVLVTLTGHSAGVKAIAFSPDGQTIATASIDETIKLWTMEGLLIQTLTGVNSPVTDVKFSPDGQTLASGDTNNQVILWDLSYVGDLNQLLQQGCSFVDGYLKHHPEVRQNGRAFCTDN